MLVKCSAIFLSAVGAAVLSARIPTIQNYGTVSNEDHVHHGAGNHFLITDITKPLIKSKFQANCFSESCNDWFLGQVIGSGGANCVRSISGTRGKALIDQPAVCSVTIYTDKHCSDGATLLAPGQCLQETETGLPSYSIDENCWIWSGG